MQCFSQDLNGWLIGKSLEFTTCSPALTFPYCVVFNPLNVFNCCLPTLKTSIIVDGVSRGYVLPLPYPWQTSSLSFQDLDNETRELKLKDKENWIKTTAN